MKMKALVIVLLCVALAAGYLARASGRRVASFDYDNILHYVASVEKQGFNRSEFDKFAYERKAMRPTIYLGSPAEFALEGASIVSLIAALAVVGFGWPKKK